MAQACLVLLKLQLTNATHWEIENYVSVCEQHVSDIFKNVNSDHTGSVMLQLGNTEEYCERSLQRAIFGTFAAAFPPQNGQQ